MSPRTLTAAPDDRSMWRRLLARTHPDAGGTHDLFIWAALVRDLVCGDRAKSTAGRTFAESRLLIGPARVPWDGEAGDDFEEATASATRMKRLRRTINAVAGARLGNDRGACIWSLPCARHASTRGEALLR